MSGSGNTHNLNDSRIQALQALQSVSERLGDILGDVANLPGDRTRRNEHGELVNEEGLPIIDITEPIDDIDTPSLSAATQEDEVIEEDNYPEPISQLSPEALAISRKHKEKILDLLEEEEAREAGRTQQEQKVELEKRREAVRAEMQKRMVTQGAELDKRRQAREMEKKMAKAFISGLAEPPAHAVVATSKPDLQALNVMKEKKTVTFADSHAPSQPILPSNRTTQQVKHVGWGDVVPGRLSKSQTSSSRLQPMKMEVIERPTTADSDLVQAKPLKPTDLDGDSDDESEPEDSDYSVALESGDEEVVLSAHQHRELALEYHRRREVLASVAGTLLPDGIQSGDGKSLGATDDWDTEDVPLNATLAHPPPKPPVSRFKASLLNQEGGRSSDPQAKDTKASSSSQGLLDPTMFSTFGSSVLSHNGLSQSIKMGKLVDGNLVTADDDEDERQREAREEEEIRQLLSKSMEDYSSIAAQVMGPTKESYWPKPDMDVTAATSTSGSAHSSIRPKPKMSRFRVNRTQARSADSLDDTTSPPAAASLTAIRPRSSTPLSGARRSSPKLLPHDIPNPSQPTSTGSPSVPVQNESSQFPRHNLVNSHSYHSTNITSSSYPTIVDSPSFRAPQPTYASPSHPENPSLNSNTRDSPTIIPTPTPRSVRHMSVMANDVTERFGRSLDDSSTEPRSQRVSRFKAERSGG